MPDVESGVPGGLSPEDEAASGFFSRFYAFVDNKAIVC
jgi:hypothetical protein